MGVGEQSSIWRRALFRLFRSTYFRRTVTFDGAAFEAFVSPGSNLRFLDPRGVTVDAVHRRFIRDWVDDDAVVWDIGANLGLFAMPAAIRAHRGRVIAFEPDADLVAALLRSLRLPRNAALNVSVHALAVSDVDGTASFQISRYSRALNKLQAVGQLAAQELRTVPTKRIDTLAESLAPPSVLKIDVEGAEMLVLAGGEQTIARHRPAILIEGPRQLSEPMSAFFGKLDYVMLDGTSSDTKPIASPVWDTIAVPREKMAGRRQSRSDGEAGFPSPPR